MTPSRLQGGDNQADRRSAATHEAGHCVVAAGYGWVGAIEVLPHGATWAGGFVCPPSVLNRRQRACVSAGGFVALCLSRPEHHNVSASDLAEIAHSEWVNGSVNLSPSDLRCFSDDPGERRQAVHVAAEFLHRRRGELEAIVSRLMTAEKIYTHDLVRLLFPDDAIIVATEGWMMSVGFTRCDTGEYDLVFSDSEGILRFGVVNGSLVRPQLRPKGNPQHLVLDANPDRGTVRGHLALHGVVFGDLGYQ